MGFDTGEDFQVVREEHHSDMLGNMSEIPNKCAEVVHLEANMWRTTYVPEEFQGPLSKPFAQLQSTCNTGHRTIDIGDSSDESEDPAPSDAMCQCVAYAELGA